MRPGGPSCTLRPVPHGLTEATPIPHLSLPHQPLPPRQLPPPQARGEAGAPATLRPRPGGLLPSSTCSQTTPRPPPKVHGPPSVGALTIQAGPTAPPPGLQSWLHSGSCPDSLLYRCPLPPASGASPCPPGHSCLQHIVPSSRRRAWELSASASWLPGRGTRSRARVEESQEGARVQESQEGPVRTEQRTREKCFHAARQRPPTFQTSGTPTHTPHPAVRHPVPWTSVQLPPPRGGGSEICFLKLPGVLTRLHRH